MQPSPKDALLLLPVENQVRELDSKLLLACVAAQRGFASVVGSRRETELRITSFPRSIYISKSVKSGNGRFFKILRKIGHAVVAWDEEALVHLPAETYYSRRLSPAALRQVSHLFAWGEENVDLWRNYPEQPETVTIHATGNPRGDLVRPEISPFYAEQADRIRDSHGEIILVNTNFNHVNAFSEGQNLFLPAAPPGAPAEFGEAAKGMTREYAEGLRRHKQHVFESFQRLIPELARSFPDHTVVVRPHPTENPAVYLDLAQGQDRIRVTNEGNVVAWLMAARVLVHNGCTTGVEAFCMGVPALSYREAVDDAYDLDFYRLPNLLSHQCFSPDELRTAVSAVLRGELSAAGGEERARVAERYLAAQDGLLASERIVEVLEAMVEGHAAFPRPSLGEKLKGRYKASLRSLRKKLKAQLPGSINQPAFQRHRYPGLPIEEVRSRVSRFQELLGYRPPLHVESLGEHFFRIRP